MRSGVIVIDAHEVGLLYELGYEVASMMFLRGSPYPVDGHEALLRGHVVLIRDFVQGRVEVADW
jgi:hypothetical protein